MLVVQATDGRSEKRDTGCILRKGRLDVVQVCITVQVIGIDIGNDCESRRETQKVRSYSSASMRMISPSPDTAFEPNAATFPPTITVGSNAPALTT